MENPFNIKITDSRTEEQKALDVQICKKLREYEKVVGGGVDTENLVMNDQKLLEMLEYCIRHKKKFDDVIGFHLEPGGFL